MQVEHINILDTLLTTFSISQQLNPLFVQILPSFLRLFNHHFPNIICNLKAHLNQDNRSKAEDTVSKIASNSVHPLLKINT